MHPSPTQTHATHGDTRRGGADCRLVVATQPDIPRPHTLRPGESHEAAQTAAGPGIPRRAVTPRVPDGAVPHTQTHPQGRGPRTPSPCPGPRTSPGRTGPHTPRWPEPSPRPRDTPRPPARPAELARRPPRKGNLRAQHLPGLPAGCPCPATRHPRPRGGVGGWAGPVGTRESWPLAQRPSAGAGPGVWGVPLPSPAPAGSPGRGGKSWGEPGFRLEPQLPVRPPRGRKRGRGGQLRPSCPLPQTGLGAGSAGRSGASKGGGGGGGNEKAPPPQPRDWCLLGF